MAKRYISDADAIRKLATFVAVVPGYRDVFGKLLGMKDFYGIIKKYDLFSWLSHLSRLQLLLVPPHHTNKDRHRAAFFGVVGNELKRRIAAWEKDNLPHRNCILFVEPQIAVLQQLVILHAPERGGVEFVNSTDFDQFAVALLASWDLLEAKSTGGTGRDLLATLTQVALRSNPEPSPILAARAFHLYRIGEKCANEKLEALQNAFSDSTGVSLSDYLLGGLTLSILEESRDPQEIAAAWTPIAPSTPTNDPLVGDYVGAYCSVRCRQIHAIRDEIARFDRNRPIHEYSLVGLSRFPIVEFPGRGRFALSSVRVAESLFDGIRHAIKTSINLSHCKVIDGHALGSLIGDVTEDYVHAILAETFGTKYVIIPRSNTRLRADSLILYPDKVIVCEIKSRFVGSLSRKGPRTIDERVKELEQMDIPKAARQIAATINELRSGSLNTMMGRELDWTSTTLIPLIITAQEVPLIWEFGKEIDPLTDPIRQLLMQNLIGPVRFLSVADAERLPDLSLSEDISQMLLRWGRDPSVRDGSFSHYLNMSQTTYEPVFLKTRYAKVLHYLAEHCGLDVSKLEF